MTYSAEQIAILYQETQKRTPLSELEEILSHPHGGIIGKLGKLSKQEPDKWTPEMASFYRKRWKRHQTHRHHRYLGNGHIEKRVIRWICMT